VIRIGDRVRTALDLSGVVVGVTDDRDYSRILVQLDAKPGGPPVSYPPSLVRKEPKMADEGEGPVKAVRRVPTAAPSEPAQTGLAGALVAAQAKMPAVAKDSENPHFKSKFTSLDALVAATRPILNEHGLAITQSPMSNPDTGFPILRTTILHGPSGERMSADTPLYLARNDMQAFGAAVTYARRYAWAAALGVASEEDDDGQTAGQADQAKAAAKPAAKPEPKMITDAQIRKIGATVGKLTESGETLPLEYPEAESWVDVLRLRLEQEYSVGSRKALTSSQASDLIDWLEAQAIPF
jgi:ERF superfamily